MLVVYISISCAVIVSVGQQSATKCLGMRGQVFNMQTHQNAAHIPVDTGNNLAAVNPFSDGHESGNQSGFMHTGNQGWPQQGQQQWVGVQGARQPAPGSGFSSRPPVSMSGNQYGYHANQSRAIQRFPHSPSSHGMYSPHNAANISPHSPGRGQVSPGQGQLSPIQRQMSPLTYQSQRTQRPQGSPYSQQLSPEFVPPQVNSGPLAPSQHKLGNLPPVNEEQFQRSQLNQKIQSIIQTKRLTHNPSLGLDPLKSDGYLVKRPMPNAVKNRQEPSELLHSMMDQRQQFGLNQALSVMTSVQSPGDSYQQGINCTSSAQYGQFAPVTLPSSAQRQSAINNREDISSRTDSFSNTRGYLLKHLEALRNQKTGIPVVRDSPPSSQNNMKSDQLPCTYSRQNSVPNQHTDYGMLGDTDHNFLTRRLSTGALNQQSLSGNRDVNLALQNNLPSVSQAYNRGQIGPLSNSLSQHFAQHGISVSTTQPSPTGVILGANSLENRTEHASSFSTSQKTGQMALSMHYEQISPPVTPMVSPGSAKTSAHSTPSPSSHPPLLSPLQKLLLNTSPPTIDPEPSQHSHSRNSASNASPLGLNTQKSLIMKSVDDRGTFSPPAVRKGIENSKLYSLLSGEKQKTDMPKAKPERKLPLSQDTSLNDSQEDIFADIDTSKGRSNSNTEMDDSLMSLFSDDCMVKPITDENESDNVPQSPVLSVKSTGNVSSGPGTLSGLQDLVASVKKGVDFGVNFNKQAASANERPQYHNQLSNSSVGSLDSSLGSNVPGTPQPSFQQNVVSPQENGIQSSVTAQQSPSSNQGFNVTQNPYKMQHNMQSHNPHFSSWSQTNMALQNQAMKKPKGEPGKRGRPRLNKSLSVPNTCNPDGTKKKRGRPRKTQEPIMQNRLNNFQQPQMQVMQTQHHFETMNQRRMSLPDSMNSNPPFVATQKSFQELLEGEPTDLLAELEMDPIMKSFGSSQGMSSDMNIPQFSDSLSMQEVVPPFSNHQSVQPATSFAHGASEPIKSSYPDVCCSSADQSTPYQQVPPQSTGQHLNQQHYHLQSQYNQQGHNPHHQQQPQCDQYMSTQPFCHQSDFNVTENSSSALNDTDEPSTELNLSQAMDISEPAVNFDTGLSNCLYMNNTTEDSDYGVDTNIHCFGTNGQCSKTVSNRRERSMSSGLIDKRRHSSSNKKSKLEADFSHISDSSSDISAIMELMRYRQHSVPKSPAYTFKFQVTTPVFKKLKFIMRPRDKDRNPRELVRMHPKDARKYSLLKIGREVIKLHCLTERKITEIKEKFLQGENIEAVPPAIRTVELANIRPKDALIVELLSANSPAIEEGVVNDETKHDTSETPESGDEHVFENVDKVKRPRKNFTQKDTHGPMFKGNIANVPHLKKFRQGFLYFGKGQVGRGGHMKVRQNHPGLPQEFEDDENIVLKDVSLNDASDGVLTPIKSRTPVAGRSPAYYSGNVSILEQEKDFLESKLEDLKYDLDLNQSGNSNTFQDAIFNEKEMEKESFVESNQSGNEVKSDPDRKQGIVMEKGENEVEKENNFNNANTGNDTVDKNIERLSKNGTCMEVKSDDSMDDAVIDGNDNVSKSCITTDVINHELSTSQIKSKNENCCTEKGRNRSRSSSLESNSRSSCAASQANSFIVSGEDVTLDSSSSSVNVTKRRHSAENVDTSKRQRRTASMNSSSAPGSRKGSRSSSCDTDSRSKKTKTKQKTKHRPYRYDSDSDGIPGVDYIVTNRFKGQKELRVVVDKLDVDSVDYVEKYADMAKSKNGFKTESYGTQASSTDSEVRNTCESEGEVKKEPDKPFTGFSAEFEKFIAQTCPPPESDSDTEDCDLVELVTKTKNNETKDSRKSSVVSTCGDIKHLRLIDRSQKINDHTGRDELNMKDEITEELKREVLADIIKASNEESADVFQEGTVKKTMDSEYSTGECMCVDVISSSCSCLNCCKNTNVNTSVSSLTGGKDFSSSSEDEDFDVLKKGVDGLQRRNQTGPKTETKKRKQPNKLHDGRAFCTKKPRKKRQRAKPTKLMCTLSVLHHATLEKLTNTQFNSDIDSSSSNQSPCKNQSASDVESSFRVRVKTPDFELYSDKTNDHKDNYEDTMYTFAYLSPIPSEQCNDSPPQPLSPVEMTKLDGTIEAKQDKEENNEVHKEQKMTVYDLFKTNDSTMDSDKWNEKSNDAPSTPSRIAVAKTTTLTLQDIKSLCMAENENEMMNNIESESEPKSETEVKCVLGKERMELDTEKKSNCEKKSNNVTDFFPILEEAVADSDHQSHFDSGSPPPDLGPPVYQSSLLPEKTEDLSRPPLLSPNRQLSSNSDVSLESEEFVYAAKLVQRSPRNSMEHSTPPLLFPCNSPKQQSSTKILTNNPHCARSSDMVDDDNFMCKLNKPVMEETKFVSQSEIEVNDMSNKLANNKIGDFMNLSSEAKPKEGDVGKGSTESKGNSGRSPGGSITVVHSEEFSDISDENDVEGDCHGQGQSHSRSKVKKHVGRQSSGMYTTPNAELLGSSAMSEKERKLREIKEFEERMNRSDKNKSNIFDLLVNKEDSTKHSAPYFEHVISQAGFQIPFNAETPVESHHFQFNGAKFPESFGAENYPKNVNTYLHMPERFKNTSDYEFSQISHGLNAKRDFGLYSSVPRAHRNGDYQRSFSQNDMKLKYPVNGLNNGMVYNGFSPDHNQRLNKTFSNAQRLPDTNGKYPVKSRNFFENFLLENGAFGKGKAEDHNTASNSEMFHSDPGTNGPGNSRFPSLNRSLSDSSRSEYFINQNSKLSESFVKNLKNYMNKGRSSQNLGENRSGIIEHGCGGGVNRKSKTSKSQAQNSDSSSNNRNSKISENDDQDIAGFHGDEKGQGHAYTQGHSAEMEYGCQVITPLAPPPSLESIQNSSVHHGLSTVQPLNAYYGNHKDLPEKARYNTAVDVA